MSENYKNLVKNFKDKKILVLGDVVLDLYLRGTVDRLSPEAPVPVVLERKKEYVLGGAGNVAANIASLGGKVTLVGLAGSDPEKNILEEICRRSGIICKFIFEKGRPTTLKTRVVVERHQLARVDREIFAPLSRSAAKKLIGVLKKSGTFDAVVVSDYNKGCLSREVMEALREKFGGSKIIAGLKPVNADLFKGVRTVVLNLKEAAELTGILSFENSSAGLAAKKISRLLNASVILTRGEKGMTAYDKKTKKTNHIQARMLQVYDVTGAGDTVLAAVVLALAAGADLLRAAKVANCAAGVVVSKEGTAVVFPKELEEAVLENV